MRVTCWKWPVAVFAVNIDLGIVNKFCGFSNFRLRSGQKTVNVRFAIKVLYLRILVSNFLTRYERNSDHVLPVFHAQAQLSVLLSLLSGLWYSRFEYTVSKLTSRFLFGLDFHIFKLCNAFFHLLRLAVLENESMLFADGGIKWAKVNILVSGCWAFQKPLF